MIRSWKLLLTPAVILATLFPLTASFGDNGGRITVQNGTSYFIHVYLGSTEYLYVRPGGAVSLGSVEGSTLARVFYAPAQGVAGGADSVLTISAVYDGNFDCAGGGGCGSSTKAESGVSYTSATWHVTPEILHGGTP